MTLDTPFKVTDLFLLPTMQVFDENVILALSSATARPSLLLSETLFLEPSVISLHPVMVAVEFASTEMWSEPLIVTVQPSPKVI